jgi:hypothetical protein
MKTCILASMETPKVVKGLANVFAGAFEGLGGLLSISSREGGLDTVDKSADRMNRGWRQLGESLHFVSPIKDHAASPKDHS